MTGLTPSSQYYGVTLLEVLGYNPTWTNHTMQNSMARQWLVNADGNVSGLIFIRIAFHYDFIWMVVGTWLFILA